jgi:hypothetical protein
MFMRKVAKTDAVGSYSLSHYSNLTRPIVQTIHIQ